MTDPNGNSQTQIVLNPQGATDEREALRPVLVVVKGTDLGRRFLLGDKRLILGRDPDRADLILQDQGVSGTHAMLSLLAETGECEVMDLESRNGTWLNGAQIERGPLCEGDKLAVGQTLLKFTLHDSVEDEYHGELDRMLHIDSLTGLHVRRWFDREYPLAFERARRLESKLSLLMMDLDGLKRINDSHGHRLGSYCISEAGEIIRNGLPAGAAAGARFGGDEFVAWIEGRNVADALDIAESIRTEIDRHEFCQDGIRVAPTISIGVAELDTTIHRSADLMQLADDALYRAKKAGRNAVSL